MRLREPAAVVALVGVALHVVLSVLSAADSPVPVGPTLGDLAYRIADPVLLVLLTALLVACWLPEPTPHARGLTVTGLLLTASLLAAILVLAVVALTAASWPEGRERTAIYSALVTPATVTTICLAAQIALVRRPAQQPATPPAAELPAAEPEPDPEQQPTWTPDAAVGTVWRRAGDAASQRPSTSWDSPGQTEGGWGPRSSPDPPPEPTRRAGE